MNRKHDKTNILSIGEKLFREKGYHNTGTEEILEKADYPRSSFYHHFKNKEGFGVKTVEFYGQNIKELLMEKLVDEKTPSPTARLRNYFFMICAYNESSCYGSSCLVQRMAFDAGETPGAIQEEAFSQYQQWVEVASKCVGEGQEQGEIRKDMSKEEISELLYSTIYGAYTIGRLSRDLKEMEKKMENSFMLIKA